MEFIKKYKIWFFIIGFVLLMVFGTTIFSNIRKTVTLTVWGTNFTDEQFDILSRNIKGTSRNGIKFVYTEIKQDDYETELMSSFIHSESPDIFLMNNEQIGKFKKLVSPLNLANKNYNINNLKKDYPTIIEEESVLENQLYMLPISIDSLVLYYNRNIFDSLSIPNPPKTWPDLLKLISTLRQLDAYNRISRSPIAMGTGKNVTNSPDILSLLIMQLNGKIINTAEQRVTVNERVRLNDTYINAGEEALAFYAQFAQSNNQYYSWNNSFENDLDAFANNKLAIYIGYRSDKEKIIKKNSNLNFGISEMPQINIDQNINFGKFFGFTVSSQSKNTEVAWEALNLLMSASNVKNIIDFSKLPPANRQLINEYYNDNDLSIFAKQALNSKSFYHPNNESLKDIFIKIIDKANTDRNYRNAISELSQDLTNLMYKN